TGEKAAQPGQILREERLIQPQFSPLSINDFLRDSAFIAIEFVNGVAAGDAHHSKGQESDANENGNELHNPLKNIFLHGHRSPLRKFCMGSFFPSIRNMGVEALLMRSSLVQTCRQISGSAEASKPRSCRTPRSH